MADQAEDRDDDRPDTLRVRIDEQEYRPVEDDTLDFGELRDLRRFVRWSAEDETIQPLEAQLSDYLLGYWMVIKRRTDPVCAKMEPERLFKLALKVKLPDLIVNDEPVEQAAQNGADPTAVPEPTLTPPEPVHVPQPPTGVVMPDPTVVQHT